MAEAALRITVPPRSPIPHQAAARAGLARRDTVGVLDAGTCSRLCARSTSFHRGTGPIGPVPPRRLRTPRIAEQRAIHLLRLLQGAGHALVWRGSCRNRCGNHLPGLAAGRKHCCSFRWNSVCRHAVPTAAQFHVLPGAVDTVKQYGWRLARRPSGVDVDGLNHCPVTDASGLSQNDIPDSAGSEQHGQQ